MTMPTQPVITPDGNVIDAGTLDALLSSMAKQAEAWRREAGNAGVANHALEEQYYLGIGAGLKMAASMLESVGSQGSKDRDG